MCGICGIFDPLHRLTGSQLESDIPRMMTEFGYRGPDGKGTQVNASQGIGLGHVRLSIIDLAGGQQPMSNADQSLWITFNGEIYNFLTERDALVQRGYRFRTRSDTETILALYETYGTGAWEHLSGQFAFGLWDGKKNQLHVVRDRLGEKPLVYAHHNQVFYFASEVKALLRCHGLPRELDRTLLGTYFLTQSVPAPVTLIKGVEKVPPGHFLTVDTHGVISQPYWKPTRSTVTVQQTPEQAVDAFKTRFQEAVKRCTVSDVPIGTYLSGGLDSTSVTAIVKEIHPEPFHTFAIFNRENHETHPDWQPAQEAAAQFKTQHHNVFYEIDELMAQIPELIERTDEPFEGPTVLVSYFLAKHAREHVKVILTGNGGDELLGGYQAYYQGILKSQSAWQKIDTWLPGPLRSLLSHAGSYPYLRRLGLSPTERRIEASLGYYQDWFDTLLPHAKEETRRWLSQIVATHRLFPIKNYFKQYLWDDLLVYHHRSITVMPDATGMACSLEARNPFLDHALVEFLLSVGPELLISQSQNKYLLAKAIETRVPASVIHRKKEGFSGMTAGQMNRWMRTQGRRIFHDALLDSKLVKAGYLDRSSLEKIWTQYEAVTDPQAAVHFQLPIWSAGMLAQWYDRHVAA